MRIDKLTLKAEAPAKPPRRGAPVRALAVTVASTMLALGAPVASTAQDQLGLQQAARGTGTETVRCDSGWRGSEGEAEYHCLRELDSERASAESRLEAQNRRVIGGSTYPLSCESEVGPGDQARFRCTGRAEINWEEEAFAALSATSDKAMASVWQAAEPDPYIVVEDEMIAAFGRPLAADTRAWALRTSR